MIELMHWNEWKKWITSTGNATIISSTYKNNIYKQIVNFLGANSATAS